MCAILPTELLDRRIHHENQRAKPPKSKTLCALLPNAGHADLYCPTGFETDAVISLGKKQEISEPNTETKCQPSTHPTHTNPPGEFNQSIRS
jgi:hypothetical protein